MLNEKNYNKMVNDQMYDIFKDAMSHILNNLIDEDHESESESNEIKSMADNLFELYTNFQTAGFEKEQAFKLMLAIIGK